jgi:predicted lipid-binding transport protein (Tim44 family)
MSVAKIFAVLSAIVGLIEGIVLAGLGSMMGDMLSGTPVGMLGIFGYSAIIMFPVGGAISGFIGGAIGALLYNFVAGRIGGIEIDLVQAAGIRLPTPPATVPAAAPVVTTPPAAAAAPGKFCSSCGAKISATAKFCGKCGANQE